MKNQRIQQNGNLILPFCNHKKSASSEEETLNCSSLQTGSSLIPLLLLFKSKRLFRFEDALVQRGQQALVESGDELRMAAGFNHRLVLSTFL